MIESLVFTILFFLGFEIEEGSCKLGVQDYTINEDYCTHDINGCTINPEITCKFNERKYE